jgi:Tfp pilus assembly protein PilF
MNTRRWLAAKRTADCLHTEGAMSPLRWFVAVLALCAGAPLVQAGLYYTGENFAELPSQWRGYLVDQRALRTIAVTPKDGAPNPMRKDYLDAAARIEKTAKDRKLSADEQADLGAIYVRLGELTKAVELLRTAQREHPNHFRVNANLGTAWQLRGDLDQAALCLENAVTLSPGKYQKAEEYHLKLVRSRLRAEKNSQDMDDLFGVRFVDDKGEYTPGKLAPTDAKKLPSNAAAIVQQLGLSLPTDGRLLWQLAELANAHGDPKMAAAIFDGCVTEFGMNNPELRRRRQITRAAADALAEKTSDKVTHEGHAGAFKPKSRRPLANRLDISDLPPINADGVNELPWAVLGATTLDAEFRPTFVKYLKELDGKQIALAGFMQPLREDGDLTSFMLIEYPVGCWYCETPEITGIVLIEMAPGEKVSFTRSLVKITGKLKLNATDPESFLYSIGKAKVTPAD